MRFGHEWADYHRRVQATDSADEWACCEYWPRKLLNKWNAREFAVRHGVTVPELYGTGRWSWQLPAGRLPGRYVVRPFLGSHDRGVLVVVDGHELLKDLPLTAALAQAQRRGRAGVVGRRYLVEEFIGPGDRSPRLPLEYKCHAFAGHVAAVQVEERVTRRPRRTFRRYYRPDWSGFEGVIDSGDPEGPPRPPPAWLPTILDASSRLSESIGSYMRVDFLEGANGPVFNEFSSTPLIGKPTFTALGDEVLGNAWRDACPDAV